MSYLKNTASQKFNVLAINAATSLPVTGDAANITAKISLDSGAFSAVTDTNPTELDATNAPGVYVFDLSQAETNGDVLTVVPSSSTANVQMDMLNIYTVDPATYKADVSGLATAISLGIVDGKCTSILTDTGTTIPAQITALNNFDPASDTVANVTLVATTTTNTDMRGTDGAAAASSLSITNSNVNGIKATTDQLTFTVANQVDANSLTGGTSPTDVADAVWDEAYASHTTAGTFGKLMDQLRKANQAIDGEIDGASTTTSLNTDLTGYTDEAFASELLLFVSGALNGESRPVLSYNGTTGVMTFEEPWTQAPSSSDEFVILPAHIHALSEISAGVFNKFTDGSNEDLFKADVSGLNTVVPDNASVAAIKAKTDQFVFTVSNQVDANALTGGGGDDAATIYTYFTNGTNEDAFKADVTGPLDANITRVNGSAITLEDLQFYVNMFNPVKKGRLEIVAGDSYKVSIGNPIRFVDSTFPDLSTVGNTGCKLTIVRLNTDGTETVVIDDLDSVTVDNATKTVVFEIEGSTTSTLDPTLQYRYDVEAQYGTDVVTIVRSHCDVTSAVP